jgi:hypothetical protein
MELERLPFLPSKAGSGSVTAAPHDGVEPVFYPLGSRNAAERLRDKYWADSLAYPYARATSSRRLPQIIQSLTRSLWK